MTQISNKNAWVDFDGSNKTDNNDVNLSTPDPLDEKNSAIAEINISSHEEQSVAKRLSFSTARVAPILPVMNNVLMNTKNEQVVIDVNNSEKTATNESQQSFKNGKLLTSVYPVNEHCAWILLPRYEPIKMPKILSHKQIGLSLTNYEQVMKTITTDIRFVSYCALYSRVIPIWMSFSVFILLVVLFSSQVGSFPIVILVFFWVFMLLLGIFFGIIIRKYLVIALKQLIREANKLVLTKNLLIGIQDRGQLSCHKVVVLFIYYELNNCKKDLSRLIQVHKTNEVNSLVSSAIDKLIKYYKFPTNEDGRLAEENSFELAAQIILDYTQEYVKAYIKKQLLFPTRPNEGVSEFLPKHCEKSYCICQFIEAEFFNPKIKRTWYENLK